MSDQRDGGIAWTDVTWNPVRGCSRVSEGCRHCYAERYAARFSGPGLPYEGLAHRASGGRAAHWTGKVVLVPERLSDPLHWRRPRKVFVNSMSDLFHESLTDEQIDRVVAVMAWCRQHTYQILTKRAARMRDYSAGMAALSPRERSQRLGLSAGGRLVPLENCGELEWPFPWVWFGVSAEFQSAADARVPLLLQTPAAVRWVSLEPQLGSVDFTRIPEPGRGTYANALVDWYKPFMRRPVVEGARVGWVVVGGESGPSARPFDLAWARRTVEQCKAAGVPVFVKQLGANVRDVNDGRFAPSAEELGLCGAWPDNNPDVEHDPDGVREEYQGAPVRVHLRKRAGADPSEWPADLRVREFPAVSA